MTDLLTTAQLAAREGVTVGCVRNWRSSGRYGPAYRKLSYRTVRYDLNEVVRWERSCERGRR